MNGNRPTVAAMALLMGMAAVPAQITAYHEATSADHAAHVQNLGAAGYRMITLSIYGTAASPRYAAVWVQRPGPAFLPFQDLTGAQYQSLVTTHGATHVPAVVTAMGSGSGVRFAGVLEQAGHAVWAQHGLTAQGMSDAAKAAREAGWRIRSADVYGTGNDPRFVVTFRPNPDNVAWGYYTASGPQDHQAKFDGLNQAYARPLFAAFNDDSSCFLCAWEDTIVPAGPVHHAMTAAGYDTLANQYWTNDSRYPLSVCASGNGGNARFAAIWSTTDVPLPRQWTVTGTGVPQFAPFDGWVQNLMQSAAIRGAQLAIARDGELKYARAYTWAEPGYAPVQPTSTFRIASCTKPLTSIAIHRAIAKNPGFDYSTPMWTQFPQSNYADPDNSLTTIEMLLRHQGGWDRDNGNNGNAYDPMFIDATILAANPNLSYPISIADIRRYMEQQPLDFVPGTDLVYSNYGYSLLGRILERQNPGKTYEQVLEQQIFQPLGLLRPQIGRTRRHLRLPGEVLYHPRFLAVRTSVVDATPTFVPSHYGGWNQENLDSHGAHVMAACDFAKILAAFDLGIYNPILHPAQVAEMWTQTGTSNRLQGWKVRDVSDGNGGTVAMRYHGGSLPGTRTVVARRADGLSFVLFTNGDRDLDGVDAEALSDIANTISLWPQHDLFPAVGIGGFNQIGDVQSPFGSPCPGSAGTPLHVASGGSMIGGRTGFDLTGAAPGVAAVLALGFARTQFDLGALGAPGCSVFVTPAATNFVPTGRTGTASWLLQLPLDPTLVGLHLMSQWVIFDPRANALGVHTSNGLDVRVGGWLGS